MENNVSLYVGLSFFVVMIIISAHYFTKIMEWNERRIAKLYRNNSTEFVADLYKMKMKWAKRGEYMFCKAIDSVIGAEMMSNLQEDEKTPETEYGKDFILKMKDVLDEEVKKNAETFS